MTRKVLVLDESISGCGLWSLLADEGYAVEAAPTHDDGLERLSPESHDVIIIREKPDTESWLLCEEVRRRSSRPLIVISPGASIETSVKAIRAGADCFMIRPFGPLEFSARVRSLLRRDLVAAR